MGPEKRKGESPTKSTGEEGSGRRAERKEPGQTGAARDAADSDPREEEGWSQPESSAQKGSTSHREDED
jgi:hypothetical protein